MRGCALARRLARTMTGRLTILVRQTVSHVLTKKTLANYPSTRLLLCLYIRNVFSTCSFTYSSRSVTAVRPHFHQSSDVSRADVLLTVAWHIAQIFRTPSVATPLTSVLALRFIHVPGRSMSGIRWRHVSSTCQNNPAGPRGNYVAAKVFITQMPWESLRLK